MGEIRSPVVLNQPPMPVPYHQKSSGWGQTDDSFITINDGNSEVKIRVGSAPIKVSVRHGVEGRTIHVNSLDDSMLDLAISTPLPTTPTDTNPPRPTPSGKRTESGVESAPKRPRIKLSLKPREDVDSASTKTFHTAQTHLSHQTYHSASSETGSAFGNRVYYYHPETEHTQLLRSKSLLPIDPMIEQNWSGKGQHVEYSTSEKSLLRSILQVEDTLGSTSTALVESVKCRRILLARKTVRCNRRITKEIAIDEVAHLSRFNHAHIVRVIGTYSMGETLSILMYPVADWNLETFLSYLDSGQPRGRDLDMMRSAVYTFFNCLTNTVAYIHRSLTKHMDIKPQNILVRDCRHWGITPCYKVYITDFGIARSYTSLDVSETEGPTMFTRRYAAPEVVDGQKRGLPADIFSLGCVFLEMAAVLLTKDGNSCLQRLKDRLAHNEYGDTSYQANLSSCYRFIQLDIYGSNLGSVNLKLTYIGSHMYKMLTRDPAKRPSASELTEMTLLKSRDCCSAGAEPFEVAREATDDTVDPKDSTVTMPPTPRPRPSKDLTAIKRPKPKRRSDVPPQIPSPTPVSPLTLHQLTTPPHSPEWDNHQHKNFISESNL